MGVKRGEHVNLSTEERERRRLTMVETNSRRKGVPTGKNRWTAKARAASAIAIRARFGVLPPDRNEVLRLWNEGVRMGEIAKRLHTSDALLDEALTELGYPRGRRRHYTEKQRDATRRSNQERWSGADTHANRLRAAFGPQRGLRIGVCAICHRDGKVVRDHDHATGLARKLICPNCNIGLGNFRDDPALLEAAAAYIREHAPTA